MTDNRIFCLDWKVNSPLLKRIQISRSQCLGAQVGEQLWAVLVEARGSILSDKEGRSCEVMMSPNGMLGGGANRCCLVC